MNELLSCIVYGLVGAHSNTNKKNVGREIIRDGFDFLRDSMPKQYKQWRTCSTRKTFFSNRQHPSADWTKFFWRSLKCYDRICIRKSSRELLSYSPKIDIVFDIQFIDFNTFKNNPSAEDWFLNIKKRYGLSIKRTPVCRVCEEKDDWSFYC